MIIVCNSVKDALEWYHRHRHEQEMPEYCVATTKQSFDHFKRRNMRVVVIGNEPEWYSNITKKEG